MVRKLDSIHLAFRPHTIWIAPETHKELRRIAFAEERNVSHVVRELILLGLEKRKEMSDGK